MSIEQSDGAAYSRLIQELLAMQDGADDARDEPRVALLGGLICWLMCWRGFERTP